MPISFRRPVFAGSYLLVPALLLCLLGLTAPPAIGQEATPPTAFQKQLNRIDFAITAVGEISTPVSGIEQRDADVPTVINGKTYTSSTFLNIKPSSTVGELGTIRYTAHPYLGVGGGTIRFKPTPYGGQGLPFQYRAAYYYQLGIEDTLPGSNFGMRLGFRQLIYLAPDFLQNYLTITRRTRTSEPTIGFFVRF